jgi:hypothetical protein
MSGRTNRRDEISGQCSRVHVTLGSESDGVENGLIFHGRANYDNAHVWVGLFQGGHYIEQVLAGAVTQQHQIYVLLGFCVR